MSSTARTTAKAHESPTIARLTKDDLARVARQHLAELADHQRRAALERKVTSFPRARYFGRAIWLGGVSIIETLGDTWRWVWSPRRPVGRLWARVRLLAPSRTWGPWTVLLLVFALAMGYVRFRYLNVKSSTGGAKPNEVGKAVTELLAGGAFVALLVLLWNDLFRLPFLAWRIRRRVIRRPGCVLLPNLLARQAALPIEQIELEIVPRTELYDDLLPGVLARDSKDVQIVVGDAGAGKTTALIGIAQLLAKTGIVSVVVPLRSDERSDLIEQAEKRFKQQVDASVRSNAEAELLWRWLMSRRRVAVLADDIDQIGPDGERGFVLRQTLDQARMAGVPVIVTARPAGVPAGVAASAIDLGALDERDAVDHVLSAVKRDPSFGGSALPSRRRVEEWITAGELADVPFYLELLAQLAAVGQCRRLLPPESLLSGSSDSGRLQRTPSGEYRWNALWVRFMLLEHYYEQIAQGRVRRSLGMEPRERRSTLEALERAALGTLVATSLGARMRLEPRELKPGGTADMLDDRRQPLRCRIREFIDTDDRAELNERTGSGRQRVSAHEVIDAGERLLILERDPDEETRFRHRIMQTYLAARCLAWRESAAGNDERRTNPTHAAQGERDWIGALLDHHHPEKLTAHMTLMFAALRANEIAAARAAQPAGQERGNQATGDPGEQSATWTVSPRAESREQAPRPTARAAAWREVAVRIVERLIEGAEASMKRCQRGGDEEHDSEPRTLVTLATEAEGRASLLSVALSGERDAGGASPANGPGAKLDPLRQPDPEQRVHPDDALMKLTTAAEIVRMVQAAPGTAKASEESESYMQAAPRRIMDNVGKTAGATRWTKLSAIEAIADLREEQGWRRIWEFARDPDYDVRRTASASLEENAYEAFTHLASDVEELIARAAARSAFGHWLVRPEQPLSSDGSHHASRALAALRLSEDGWEVESAKRYDVNEWKLDDILKLKALGWVLPAIVSGFREDPSIEQELGWRTEPTEANGQPAAGDPEDTGRDVMCHEPPAHPDRLNYARRARRALEDLVALAFEGGHGDLEAAVAQGFKSDAFRHAGSLDRNATGPGWVTCNRQLVADVCLEHAEFWYARLALYQALTLYAVAGANPQETLDVFARHLHRGGRDRHPFTQRGARLARAAVRRHQLSSGRWLALLWGDESKDAARRAPQLSRATAQLLADVTLLLNLNQSSPEDRQDAFVQMKDLPYCLSRSHDRGEILGGGCPSSCGWGLCPYRQQPPDEPDSHRGVSRAFCRQQRELALHRKPRWQRAISRRKLRGFWREMEYRART